MDERDADLLERATAFIVGNHSPTVYGVLLTMFGHMAQHHSTYGAGSRTRWIAALRALGEQCISLARMLETQKP